MLPENSAPEQKTNPSGFKARHTLNRLRPCPDRKHKFFRSRALRTAALDSSHIDSDGLGSHGTPGQHD
jgi:hypothetical protein